MGSITVRWGRNVACTEGEKCVQNFVWSTYGNRTLGRPVIRGRIILKLILVVGCVLDSSSS
jgi:hypothetical protein